MLNCCLLIQTAYFMKLKQKMSMKIFIKTKICLNLVVIYCIQSSLILLIKVIGKMKDEIKGRIISVFVGLNSKMYSLIDVDDEEVTKAKRVNKKIRYKELTDVLFNKKVIRHSMKRIQSKLHRIGTYDVCKISVSCFDDKRCILDDDVNSLVYFHKDMKD